MLRYDKFINAFLTSLYHTNRQAMQQVYACVGLHLLLAVAATHKRATTTFEALLPVCVNHWCHNQC